MSIPSLLSTRCFNRVEARPGFPHLTYVRTPRLLLRFPVLVLRSPMTGTRAFDPSMQMG